MHIRIPLLQVTSRYIVFVQQFPYDNFPCVYSPQWRFQCCYNSAMNLVLYESAVHKQAGLSLISHLVNIPNKSVNIPICRYSYLMLKYCGLITCWIIHAHIHTVRYVLMEEQKEVTGMYRRTKNTSIVQNMQRMVDVLDETCE